MDGIRRRLASSGWAAPGMAALLVLLTPGCRRDWVPLNPATLRAKAPKTLVVVVRENGGFFRQSPVGMGGAIAALAQGNQMVHNLGLEDPSIALGRRLGEALADEYDLQVSFETRSHLGAPSPHATSSYEYRFPPRPDADLVLELQTVGWAILTAPFQFTRYYGHYSVHVTLFGRGPGGPLAEARCQGDDPKLWEARKKAHSQAEGAALTADAPTFDEMVENHGARLKRQLAAALGRCDDRLRSEMLRIAPDEAPGAATTLPPPAADGGAHEGSGPSSEAGAPDGGALSPDAAPTAIPRPPASPVEQRTDDE